MSANTEKEWTLMFYFASDNSLASAIVSQLKAIKDAGFHKEANVIAYFDPQTKNTPSHVFDVNLVEKLKEPKKTRLSFAGNDPFVRNLVFDRLWTEEDRAAKESLRRFLKRKHIAYESETVPVALTRELAPLDSFREFLTFCQRHYPARHYMLFILGHGVVVGNDMFLLDENVPDDDEPDPAKKDNPKSQEAPRVKKSVRHSLTLEDLGKELRDFRAAIGKDSQLELLGLHSCSMSGLEVAYEIQGTTNYLLASQGPAFVGSWPYKQILTRIFNDLNDRKEDNSKSKLKNRLTKIFSFCVKNSYDFQLAGYSFDMALSDLSKLPGVSGPIKRLASQLKAGLTDEDEEVRELIKGFILLAHWDAQSFFQEQYTDLYDFCFRFNRRSDGYHAAPPALRRIRTACKSVMNVLQRGRFGDDDRLILRSEFIGPLFQYSHGMSVYFPWSEPVEKKFLDRYARYKFSKDPVFNGGHAWLDFLNTYFVATKRKLRRDEGDDLDATVGRSAIEDQLLAVLQRISDTISGGANQLDTPLSKGTGDPTGDSCECPSIKNYPSSTDRLGGYEAPLGPNFADQFRNRRFEDEPSE
jgi:Clostripain family